MNKVRGKIFLGTVIVVLISIVNIFFSFSVMYVLFSDNDRYANPANQVWSLIFTVGIFYFPFRYGQKLRKLGRNERIKLEEVAPLPEPIRLTAHLLERDFRKLISTMVFSNPIFMWVLFLGGSFMVGGLINEIEWSLILIGFVFAVVPFLGIIRSKKSFYANKMLKEKVCYEIDVESINSQGETYKSTIAWSSLYKVRELKNWFLLYPAKRAFLPILKKHFGSQGEVELFRQIVLSKKNLIKDLRT